MNVYEIRFTDGTSMHIDGDSPEHASLRASDLKGKAVGAWRYDRRPQIRVGMGSES